MEIQALYDLIKVNLDNGIIRESKDGMKRVRLPIPAEYGGGCATGETVEDAVRNLIRRLGIKEKKDVPLFWDCLDKWLEIKKGQNKSPSTVENYRMLIENHLKPFFSGKSIDQVNADNIQLYFNSIMHLSKSVSIQSRAILRGVFERADRNGWLDKNPMQYSYEWSKKEGTKVVLQDQELVKVIKQLDKLKGTGDDRDYLYFCFLCFTALRRGEILGLRWRDICFDNEEIHVVNNVTFPNGCNDPIIRIPKDGSIGIVHLNSQLSDRLKPYQKDCGYVLPYSDEETDQPMTRSMFTKMWYRCIKLIDIHGATSHSFRASYATMMNAHCDHIDPKALQGALRHKTPDLAIKVYTKSNAEKTRKAEIEYDEYLCSACNT